MPDSHSSQPPVPADSSSSSPTPDASKAGAGLKVGMKPRHLVMMSLGSAIGAGLFVGSGAGVQAAGPAVLISYVVAGLIVVFVMRALGELVAADPNPGAFSHYAGRAMGPAAAFAVGALWWVQLCLVVAAEATAAAQIAASYVPSVPQWVIALAIMVIFTAINLTTSGSFGEFEFWFSLIKVAFVTLFLVLGAAFLFGWTPAQPPETIFADGFMPTGLPGVAAGLLVVAFAFGGIEIVAVAAAETANPSRSVTQAIKTIVWRILFLYIGSVAIIVLVLDWKDERLAESPFVAVLDTAGLPVIASLLAAVIVIALLSSMNANIYGASRMAFSMSERKMLPPGLSRTTRRGVPMIAVLATSAFGFVAVALNYFWAAEVLGVLLNIVGSTLIVTWVVTLISQIIIRRRTEAAGEELPLKMWLFPWLSYATLAGIAMIIILGLTVESVRIQILGTLVFTAALYGIGYLVTRKRRA
ncbi:amino acid permease [Brevibacterium sp. UCMA 11752]|uniref:amino acid permease n=1 Tax=Brevibacterium sp. UCMA 11752 TaxID=2745946 RepID=UPI001F2FAB21|nr:amino acid permease [Brevibacterium sp. UCMA 11752]